MNPSRRGFLKIGLAAPAVILTPGLLMPVRSLSIPSYIRYIHASYLVAFGTNSVEFTKLLYPGCKSLFDNIYAAEVKYFEHELFEDRHA